MKVFLIRNKVNNTYLVRNKNKFCKKMGLTPRLLDYTIKGASSSRYQEWHKNYRIESKLDFIESKEGDKILWDNKDIKGYTVKYDNKFNDTCDEELENLKIELKKALKQKQKLSDSLNLLRKLNRNENRYENLLEDISSMILEQKITRNNIPKSNINNIITTRNNEVAILCLSDLHFGQLVEEVNNYFDSQVADYRLMSIFEKFKKEVDIRNIKEVHFAILGDFVHAQSVITKPDMKLSSEYPEIQASIQCFHTLAKYIDEFVRDYKVSLYGVIGNESRFSNHLIPTNLNREAKNNLDTLIFEMLKQRYREFSNVSFLNNCDTIESVISVGDYNIALVHGDRLNHKELEKSTLNFRVKLSPIYGDIDMVLLGHIHSCCIGDKYARNSSLVGSNAYSNSLQIPESSVSQNMCIIGEDIKVFSLKP